ncbi:phosphatidylinositol N-acetylglucosaminyltransferase subunit H [Pelomyxa schiedti]|nr:phosphatidylinositol N-acetylglucosaminyltransferase subunit H [Pelomyxa schiedti]
MQRVALGEGVCRFEATKVRRGVVGAWDLFLLAVGVAVLAIYGKTSYVVVAGIATVAALRVWSVLTAVVQESVTVMAGVGIQLASKTFMGSTSTKFVEFGLIEDLVINESIQMYSVVPYLAIMLKQTAPSPKPATKNDPQAPYAPDLIVLFQHIMPRLHVLTDTLNQARQTLFFHSPERLNKDKSALQHATS